MRFTRLSGIPIIDLHGPVVIQLLVHLERLPQQMRLMAPALLQAFIFRPVEVIGEYWPVVWMGAFIDDDAGALTRREATDVSETL